MCLPGRAARHIHGKLVGPICARDKTCSDGPPYRTFWAAPHHRRRVSLQCSCLLNTEYFFLSLLFSIQEIRGSTSIAPLKAESSSSPNHAPPSCGRNRETKSVRSVTQVEQVVFRKKKWIFTSASALLSFTRNYNSLL